MKPPWCDGGHCANGGQDILRTVHGEPLLCICMLFPQAGLVNLRRLALKFDGCSNPVLQLEYESTAI